MEIYNEYIYYMYKIYRYIYRYIYFLFNFILFLCIKMLYYTKKRTIKEVIIECIKFIN